jgi:DnaJ-domain-containing protein 1
MQLPGRLRLTTLGDALGALYREQATGVLELTECTGVSAGASHRIHLVNGLVVDVTSQALPSAAGGARERQRSRLDALFRLSDARLTFHVARGRPSPTAPTLGPSEFLFGRPRARESASGPKRRDPVRARALSTLGLPEHADPVTVQQAFRKLASRCHPDRFPDANADQRAVLMRRFAELTAANHSLVA